MRLHRDESAQVSFLAVAGALCFIALLAMVMNTNDVIKHRVHMQEVADVTSLSAANWNARGMNLTSMINVLNSKLLTMTVLVNSLDKTLPIVEKIATVQKTAFQACTGVPFVGVFCAVMAAIVTVQEQLIKAMKTVISKIAPHTKCKSGTTVFKVMGGLQKAGEGIRSSFPAIAIAESINIASINGATFGISLSGGALTNITNPAEALKLPLVLGPKGTQDFCTAILSGGPGYEMEGYDSGKGPMRVGKKIWDIVFIPFFNLLPHPIFYGFYASFMAQIGCPPDEPDEENGNDAVQFYNLKDCRRFNATATWNFMSSDTGLIEDGSLTHNDFVPWQSLDAGQGDRPENESDFSELEGFGGSAIGDAIVPPPSFGPGYKALQAKNNESSSKFKSPCTKGDSSSGYPVFFPTSVAANLSGFTHYNGKHATSPKDEKTGTYFLKMEKTEVEITVPTNDPDPNKPQTRTEKRFKYDVDVWVLSDSGKKKLSEEELDEHIKEQTGGTGSKPEKQDPKGCRGLVRPLLLDKLNNSQNRLRFISFVYKDLGGDAPTPLPFWSTFFNEPPTRIAAYAQAQVYNELSEDMFTQDWRVRLEQASLLEKAITQSQKPSGTKIGFGEGVASDFIGSVNNH